METTVDKLEAMVSTVDNIFSTLFSLLNCSYPFKNNSRAVFKSTPFTCEVPLTIVCPGSLCVIILRNSSNSFAPFNRPESVPSANVINGATTAFRFPAVKLIFKTN